MAEFIDVLNEAGLRTGEILSRAEIHRLGKPHRAVHLYLFDGEGRLLLQQRSPQVDHYPGLFSISVVGHVDAGEMSSDTVIREAQEELGLTILREAVQFLFSYRQEGRPCPDYIDRQFNDVYAARIDFDIHAINFDKREVAALKLMPFAAFEAMVAQGSSDVAPVYAEEVKDVVFFLKQNFK